MSVGAPRDAEGGTEAAVRGGARAERGFFARPALQVAPDLVGALLVRVDDGLVARIVETEAYHQDDPASHAYRGVTPRTEVMFGPAGHLYVYFSYGMHWCANIATGAVGTGEAVLLRAAEPLAGLERMRERRRSPRARRDPRVRDLLRGPARLAQAFGLDRTWNGVDLCAEHSPLVVVVDRARPPVERSRRVGVAVAADRPWRYSAEGSPWVSPYRRHPRA